MKSNKLQSSLAIFLISVICCALWGSAFPCIKTGYKIFEIKSNDSSSQILFAGIRFFLAGLLLIIIFSFKEKKVIHPKTKNLSKIMVVSLFQTILQYIFFYIGLSNTSGTRGSILTSTSVFFSVIISCSIIKFEKINFNKIFGCVIGLLGAALINVNKDFFIGGISFYGEGFIILAALSSSFSTIYVKKYSKDESPIILSSYQFMIGGAIMAIISIIIGGKITHISTKGSILIVYMALISAVAYTLRTLLLKYNNVSKVAVYGFLTPIFGCLFSAIFLKEAMAQPIYQTIISLILVSLGIYLVNKDKGIKNEG